MFNSYRSITYSAPTYPQEIHEHRAPTDESVKLLDRMRQEALDGVLARFPVEMNGLKSTVISYKNHFQETVWAVKLDLNGVEHIYTHNFSDFRLALNNNPQATVEDFVNGFSRFLAETFIGTFNWGGVFKK